MAIDLAKLDSAIVEALGQRAAFKRRGQEIDCACPNPGHTESKPGTNFSYSTAINAAKCLGCGGKWNAKDLAQLLGIDVDSPAFKNGHSAAPAFKLAHRYDYVDADGAITYYVERHEDGFGSKKFLQFNASGKASLKGVTRLLWRLPQVLKAIDAGKWIFLVEGEKCVRAVEALGFVGTCNSGGAEGWKPELAAFLTGAKVCILADNDGAGRKWTTNVLIDLLPVVSIVKVGVLPELDIKGDVVDWIAAGGDAFALKDLVRAAPPASLLPPETAASEFHEPEHFTDLGNALRFHRHNAQDMRYVQQFGKGGRWLVWDGVRWAQDQDGEAERRAKTTVMTMHSEAAALDEYPSLRKAAEKWAYSSESRGRLESMLKLSQSEAGITVLPGALDADPWLVSCSNGTLDLRTGLLRDADRADLITKRIFMPYDAEAQCPRWERFLVEVMGGSEEMAAFLQRAAGYSLTGETSEQCVFILYGGGSNGKSTLIKMLHKALGEYAEAANIESFMLRESGAATNDIADLAGARFVSAGENDSGRRLSEALVKQLTSGESIKARFLFSEHFTFDPQMKVWLSTNHKPVIRGADHGIWRRINLVPFAEKFAINKSLETELMAELPGIFRWIVEGCKAWREQGLAVPGTVADATATYKDEMDILSDWLYECVVEERGAITEVGLLYDSYKAFLERSGEKSMFTAKKFSLLLDERGFEFVHARRARCRKNIRLRNILLDLPENDDDAQVQSATDATDRPLFPPRPCENNVEVNTHTIFGGERGNTPLSVASVADAEIAEEDW